MNIVSDEFKKAITNNARYIKAYLEYNGIKYDIRTLNIDDNIYADDKFIGTFIAKNGSITTNKTDALKLENEEIVIYMGIQLLNSEIVEYISIGTYQVYEVTNSNEFKIIDYRYKFNIPFNSSKLIYPCTPLKALQEACKQAKVELKTLDFINKDLSIPSEVFFGYNATCADVVTAVSQASCTFAKITRDNKLELKWFSNVDFSIDLKHQKKKPLVNKNFGIINSVVLSREPQNDNVYWPPEIEGERVEFKISNNPILDIDRYTSIKAIYNRMNLFEYTPFNTESQGYFHLDCGDIVKLQKEDMSYMYVFVMNHSFKFSGGVSSTFETPALTKTQIDYSIANSIESKIYNTELKVDKVDNRITAEIKEVNTKIENIKIPFVSPTAPTDPQDGQHWVDISQKPPAEYVYDAKTGSWTLIGEYTGDLEGLIGKIEELNTSLTMQQGKVDILVENNTTIIDGKEVTVKSVTEQLTVTMDGLQNKLTSTGGNNLILNSMGVYEDGWHGKWFIDKSQEIKKRNIYGFALNLANDTLKQSIQLPNGNYTLSFLYAKYIDLATVKLLINGEEFVLSNNELTNFKYSFEVTTGNIEIQFIADTDYACSIVNLMLNQGTDAMIWSLNSNESWSDTMKMSSSGLTIESSGADVLFNAKADIIGFMNKNTKEYVAIFTDVGALMNEIIIKNKAKIVGLLFQEINKQTAINRIAGDN